MGCCLGGSSPEETAESPAESETRQLCLRVTRGVIGVERDTGTPVSRESEVLGHPRGTRTSKVWVNFALKQYCDPSNAEQLSSLHS